MLPIEFDNKTNFMHITFDYCGTTHKALLKRPDDTNFLVSFEDENLIKEFGPNLHFTLNEDKVHFHNTNLSHSNLFLIHTIISRCIENHIKEFSHL